MDLRPFILLLLCLFAAAPAWSCPMDVPQVTENDLLHAPPEMLAVRAQIVKSEAPFFLGGKPHDGFTLTFKAVKIYQGEIQADTFTVSYGGCHNLPGRTGDTVSVLAIKDKDGNWYAPQHW